ncbi:DUF4355 domain-containing protein [Schinkia azotoformans]|uniref:DUF4355 domain-containing protein n=1 Tax=Schinkia azotoformans TaxID=1454 RepID=UPI002E1E58DC|nr:DUF4355 domain-containing protein [Schinkia azotoformans]
MLKKETKPLLLPLHLQFFGDGAEGTEDAGQGDNPPSDDLNKGQGETITYTEQDFQKKLQEELAKATAKHNEDIEAARSEAEKLAKMTADEKAKYEFEQREKKVEEKEKEIVLRELRAETLNTLSEKNIPQEVIDIVLADNAENTAKNIDAFKSVFDKAVQAAVEARLSGKSPQVGSGTATKGTEEQVREQFSKALKGVR